MKKTVSFLAVLLFMIVGYPVLVICGWVSGFSVIVRYPAVTFAGLTVLFLALSLPLLINKEKTVNTVTAILSAIIVPLSVVNLLVCVWENRSFAVLLMTLVWVIVSFLLMYRCGKNGILTGVLTGFSVLLLVIVLFLMVILLFFTIGQNTVVQTLPSPNGTQRTGGEKDVFGYVQIICHKIIVALVELEVLQNLSVAFSLPYRYVVFAKPASPV